jgi:alpha-ketoglutarate-dependent taurine dioxygenase
MTTFAPEVTTLAVRPLSGTIGAEIRGVDLREPLESGTVAELRDLWLRYKVVFFPGQHLEPPYGDAPRVMHRVTLQGDEPA